MSEYVEVYLEGGSKNPLQMTKTKYGLGNGKYMRYFADRETGLVFNEKDEVTGLWLGRVEA